MELIGVFRLNLLGLPVCGLFCSDVVDNNSNRKFRVYIGTSLDEDG